MGNAIGDPRRLPDLVGLQKKLLLDVATFFIARCRRLNDYKIFEVLRSIFYIVQSSTSCNLLRRAIFYVAQSSTSRNLLRRAIFYIVQSSTSRNLLHRSILLILLCCLNSSVKDRHQLMAFIQGFVHFIFNAFFIARWRRLHDPSTEFILSMAKDSGQVIRRMADFGRSYMSCNRCNLQFFGCEIFICILFRDSSRILY